MRKQAGEKNQTALHQRPLQVPSGRAAGTEPGVRNKPIRIVSGHVVIDREMALRPRGVCYLVAFSHYIFDEPQTPFTGRDRQSVFTDGGVFYKAPGGFCVTT